jgi:hypothetical protein
MSCLTRVPPTDPVSGLKYNTVTGKTRNSQVWIVYENGRAYPDYLIRYYIGQRDPMRTPYEHQEDVVYDYPKVELLPEAQQQQQQEKSTVSHSIPVMDIESSLQLSDSSESSE